MDKKVSPGFTIAELIIVLAVSSLILLAVFIAVPQVLLAQRNTKRTTDARRVLVSTFQYLKQSGTTATNTSPANCLPAGSCSMPVWLNAKEYIAPGGGLYNIYVSGALGTMPGTQLYDAVSEALIVRQRLCNGNVLSSTGTSGAYAVIIRLENITGGAGDTYCIDSRSVE